jgi:hypothetical protein
MSFTAATRTRPAVMSRNNAAAQAQLIKMTSQIVSWCRTACRTTAWTLALAIVVLSLVPPSYRPVTEASHSFEHLAIFLVTGLAFGAGYPGRPFRIAVALVIFSGTVELLQQWVPGRHARLSDFLVDGTAAEFGTLLAFTAMRLAHKIASRAQTEP